MELNGTLLLVDDDPDELVLVKNMLGLSRYNYIFAHNGKEALQLAREMNPDLILLDILMPDMDGFEVCRAVRNDSILSKIPIVMVTALSGRNSRVEGLTAGADDFITKPFDGLELEARVRSIVQLNRFQTLMEERSKFETLVNLSPDGVVVINKLGNIWFCNPALLGLLNVSTSDETIGTNIEQFIEANQKSLFSDYLKTILFRIKKTLRLETSLLRKGGGSFPADVSLGYVEVEGQPGAQILIRDISERVEVEERLRISHHQLRELAAREALVREEERTMIAREIHDELGQELTGLKMNLFWLNRRIEALYKDDEKVTDILKETYDMLTIINGTIDKVRKISTYLRPVILDDLGLIPAIEWLLEDMQKRTGIQFDFETSLEKVEITTDCSTMIFRILQEAITNIIRHSKSNHVNVTMNCKKENIILRIHDNGRGITKEEINDPRSLGLLGMRERALAFDGLVTISSKPHKGTTVIVLVPLSNEHRMEQK